MYGDFVIVDGGSGTHEVAGRLPLGDTAGRGESWLRDLLYDHPQVIPARQVAASFGPLVPLCRELRTDAGPVDIAFIDPHGQLTLVECKLWRNPEARRRVVGQILDYASVVRRWSYSDLQRQVSVATRLPGNVPYQLASAAWPNLNEHDFVDATSAALAAGRFLLLIAGDGIRSDVSAMAELLARDATIGFSFGLVEVALYGMTSGRVAIQPRLIARTQNIERTVIAVAHASGEVLLQDARGLPAENEPAHVSTQARDNRAWWAPVVAMKFDDPDQEAPVWRYPNNVRVSLPWPNTWILGYVFARTGVVGVCLAGQGGADQELYNALEPQRDEILAELPEGTRFRSFSSRDGQTIGVTRPLQSFENDGARRNWISETLNTFVNVLRPRIRRLFEEK